MKRQILNSANYTVFVIAVVDDFGRDVGYVFRYQQGGYYHPGAVIKVSTDIHDAKTYGSEVAAKRAAAQYKNYSEVYVYDGDEMPLEKIPAKSYHTHLEVVIL